ASALAPWLKVRYASPAIVLCVLFIAATNFITTIGPRHRQFGKDRQIAECIAARMGPQDLLISAEWGWPDYLEYLHQRMSLSVISDFADVNQRAENVRRSGGQVYITDPSRYSEE